MTNIRLLTPDDREPFARWRRACWPQRVGARSLDVIASKYWEHPASARCPGSGLYAYVADGEILGVVGAFPFPVRWDGGEVPGHALVDWAVIPRLRGTSIGGKLFLFGLSLPGRKYGIGGGPDSLPSLRARAREVVVKCVVQVREPLKVLGAKQMGLMGSLRPTATDVDPDALVPVDGPPVTAAATVAHRSDGLRHLARDAHLTGIALWECPAPRGLAVVSLRSCGDFRVLHLLHARWEAGEGAARAFGGWFRDRVKAHGPAYVAAYDTPRNRAAGIVRRRGPRKVREESWWVFPSDTDDGGPPAEADWVFEGLDSDQLWIG